MEGSEIPRSIANYDVEHRLGRGAMGTVYLAKDRELGRHVAIKLIQADVDSPEIRERFNREARSIAALNHPSIVTLYHAGQIDTRPYLVLEYIDGRALLAVITRREPIPQPKRLLWIEQLCDGLQYAHDRGIIHRDIKPANLMIDHLDRLRILDFGIARIFGEAGTQMSTLIGTPAYMAPEYIRGEGIDARADVFAAGAVAYELLTYQRAFSGDTHSQIMHRVLSEMPRGFVDAGATELDPELEQIVFRALNKEPNGRFQSARELSDAIRHVRARVEISAQTWIASGAAVTTTGVTHAPDVTAFAPTRVIGSQEAAEALVPTQFVDRDLVHHSAEGATVEPVHHIAEGATVEPAPSPHESRAVTPSNSNTRRYVAIGASVFGVAAALLVLAAYLNTRPVDTSGVTTTATPTVDSGSKDRGGDVATPSLSDTGKVDAGTNVATTSGATGGNITAGAAIPSGNGTIVPKDVSNSGAIDLPPDRPAYELFNATSGSPTLPGLIYRILQRSNGGTSVVSVDPRETVFRTGRDQFQFAFRSNIDGYLYVAQKSDQGDWDVVFPEPGVNGGSNRVQKNQDYIAPNPGEWFQLDPPSGTERVFVFLSKTPVPSFNELNRPVTSQASLAQAEIDKLTSTISMRKLVIAKADVPSAGASIVGQGVGVYVVNADAFANAVMVTFEMTHK